MGERIFQNWRILAAALFSVALVVGAYMFARGVESPPAAEASTETALLNAIAIKDSDGDGLPDWEESLYGTDPHIVDTFHLGMTDGEAVAKGLIVPKAIADISVATSSPSSPSSLDSNGLPPAPAEGTLTNAFAKKFFSLYLEAKNANGGADLSESQMNDVANESIKSISSIATIAPDYKSIKDLTISGSGADALRAFAASAEDVLTKNKANAKKSEILYFKDALEKDDTTAFAHISSIAKVYRDSAVGLSALPVPAELAQVDLALINAMMRISEIAVDFTRVNDDPLTTILALQQYPQAAKALLSAYINIGKIYMTADIFIPTGTNGARFVNLIKNMTDKQTVAKKP